MFTSIYTYELKHWLKSPATYIYFMVFFSISFLAFIGNGGLFDPHTEGDALQRYINSPHEINYMMQYFGKFFLFLLPAIIGATLYKDYKHGVHSILYSFPVKKREYLLGKFLSALTIVLVISLSSGLAMILAEGMPGLDPKKLGAFNMAGYLQAYLSFIFPNLIIYGAVVFAVVLWFRNIYTGFATILMLFFIQTITQNAFDGNGTLIALLDPLAQNTSQYITHLWTLEEQNNLVIPFSGPILYNRLFWLAISISLSVFTYHKFRFSEEGLVAFARKRSGKRVTKNNFGSAQSISISKVTYRFNLSAQWKNCWRLSNIQLGYIVKNWVFLGMAGLGVIAILFTLAKVVNFEDMALLPVTRIVLSVPAFFFTGIAIMITFIYAGMLIHRERTAKIDQLVDATAVPDWVLLLSKTLALVKMQAVLLLIMLVAGISIQLYNGYYQLELGAYFFHLYGVTFIVLIIWALAAILVHTLVPNLYMGLFILVMGWIGFGGLPQAGITSKLLLFNLPPDLIGSDLIGYGHALAPYFLIESYWFAFASILLVIAYLFHTRGLSETLKDKIAVARNRFTKPVLGIMTLLLIALAISGSSIYRHENSRDQLSNHNLDQAFKTFKADFQQYAKLPQPRITDVQLNIDLFPKRSDFTATGNYTVVNKTDQTITQLLVKTGFDEITTFDLNKAYQLVAQDSIMQFSVLQLEKPLAVGDSLQLSFEIKNKPNTFFERNSSVLANGTFLGSDALPRLGYSFKEAQEHPADSAVRKYSYTAIDADFVSLETTISTAGDQRAIAPGYLEKSWTKDGRNIFRYKTDRDIKFLFSFNSARYETEKDQWKDVSLEAYYHKGHDHNIGKMFSGLEAALDYNTKYLSPYQHKEARIIEFPITEGSFATTMANSIPTSELRFITNSNDEEGKVDQSFYVAAHELTHQWWGNQVVPADALGAVMISESVTEYFSLRIYESAYGKEKAKQFLKLQHNRYLQGRTKEQNEEPPLQLVAKPQQYISYGKGAVVFNTLMHYLGEEGLNAILQDFLLTYQFKTVSYPTSLDFVKHIKAATPDSLQYLVEDSFEKVVLYDNKLTTAKYSETTAGFETEVSFTIEKQQYKGKEVVNPPLGDYVQIAFYNEAGALIYLHTQKVTTSDNTLTITLDQKPARVVLDPNLLMIDREMDDQEISL